METLTYTKSKQGGEWSRPLDYVLGKLRNGTYTVTITRKVSVRTLSQNALLALWFKCIAADRKMPYQDVHDAYCALFLSRPIVTTQGVIMAARRTSDLNKEEMAEFMEQVRADASADGIRLLDPNDRYFEEFYNDYNK